MSYRSLLELNHDYAPSDDSAELIAWASSIKAYLRSWDESYLPKGVEVKWSRHHSDRCPVEEYQKTQGWE